MSVLGKRKRNETELDGKEDDHSVSNSPPKKRLRSNNDSNHNNKNSKVEMEIDAEQKKVPSFTMQAVINEDFETITDKNLEGSWTIMYFFPYAFEKQSGDNLKCLNDKLSVSNVKIIGISTDSHYASLAWIKSFDKNFKIPIASDLSTKVSQSFGILNNGRSKNCAFIISPSKLISYFAEFPSKIESELICDQLLNSLKSLQ